MPSVNIEELIEAMANYFSDPSEGDYDSKDASDLIEAIDSASVNIAKIANAITPIGVLSGRDETGGNIESLTEAVMGVTAGACRIADSIDGVAGAINNLAEAIREEKQL